MGSSRDAEVISQEPRTKTRYIYYAGHSPNNYKLKTTEARNCLLLASEINAFAHGKGACPQERK